MNFRGPLVGLSIFMVVATTMGWLVYVTLQREVTGPTTSYAALFTDITGLRVSDDVRMAGVRVGRVESIDIDGDLAKVGFRVQSGQSIFGNTVASVTYQNVIGQRYLGLSLGETGDVTRLPEGSVIPVSHTEPSFDIGTLLHGFEPLFSLLDPRQVDSMTKGVVESLQGDDGAITSLVAQTAALTETFAGRDEVLGSLIDNLNKVAGNLAAQDMNLGSVITQTHRMVSELNSHREHLVESIGSTARVVRRLAAISETVYPPFDQMIKREPGFTQHLSGIEPQLAFLGDNLPLMLKGTARIFQEGSYANGYGCDANVLGFFPGLNDVVPIIVSAATPGNVAKHTPRCRNLANG